MTYSRDPWVCPFHEYKRKTRSGLMLREIRCTKREMKHSDNQWVCPFHEYKRKTRSSLMVRGSRCTKRSHITIGEEMEDRFSNDDIAIEILSRLPIEAINELKCVCKRWCEIISRPSFTIAHFQRSTRTVSGLFVQGISYCGPPCCENYLDYKAVDYISIDKEGRHATSRNILDFLPEKVFVTASSNGVLLCRNIFEATHPDHFLHVKRRKKVDFREVVLYVCNPYTQEYTTLKPGGKYRNGCCYGFAYNPFRSSFEVVMVYPMCQLGKSPYLFMIYSSRTGTWRKSIEVCSLPDRLYLHQGRFTNGVFYWLTTGHSILTFDLKQERSQVIKLPGHAMRNTGGGGECLGVSEGNLHYNCFNMDELMVWVLENDNLGPKWTLKFSKLQTEMCHPNLKYWERGEYRRNEGHLWPNTFMHPFAFQDDILFLRVSWNMFTYSIKTGQFEEQELCSFSKLDNSANLTPVVLPYCKSLLQVQPKTQ